MGDVEVGRRQQLVDELRRVKRYSGLSFASIEARTPYSRASLERYVNGKLFPSRHAVEAIARVCGADPAALSRLWEAAAETDPPAPAKPTTTKSQPPETLSSSGPPPRQRRRVGITGTVLGLLLALPVLSSSAAPHNAPQRQAPTSGCRDYYADFHVYTLGRMCWRPTEFTVSGHITNQGGPDQAVAEVCISNHPNSCAQTIPLATADPGQRTDYTRTIALPAGYGAWVRACSGDYCSPWK